MKIARPRSETGCKRGSSRLVRSARNLAKVVVIVIRHRGDPAGELLCEFRVYPLLSQVPDTVDDREIDRLAFAPSSTLR